MGHRRWAAGAAALVLVGGLAACSSDVALPSSSWTPPTATTEANPPSGSDTSETAEGSTNDLARLPLKRAINAGPLTVNIEYNTRLPVEDWRADLSKPLHVSLTAVNKKKKGQKIYLSKAVARVTAYDQRGPIGDSPTVTDSANINPGFIVTFPNTYNQSMTLPGVDGSAQWVTLDLTYELVLEVDKSKEGRDFAKQVAVDTITVPFGQ